MLEQILKYIAGEWRVIVGAPVTLLAAILVIGFILWWALDWRYSSIISSYQGIIANRDSELALAKSQRDDYKEKLNGATPDEAKAKIQSLESRLALVEPRLKAIEPRHLDADQRAAMIARLAPPPNTSPTISIVAEVGADSPIFAQDFVSVFKSAGAWNVRQASAMGIPGTAPSGLGLYVVDNRPTPETMIVMAALRAAKVEFDLLPTSGLMPGTAVSLIVSARLPR